MAQLSKISRLATGMGVFLCFCTAWTLPITGVSVLASRVRGDKSSFSSWLVFHLELSLAFAVLAMKWELGNLLMRLYLDSQDEPICGYEEGRVVKALCHIPDGLRRWIFGFGGVPEGDGSPRAV